MSLVRRHSGMFPSLWNEVLSPDWFGGTDHTRNSYPAVNIQEGELGFTLELAIPGQQKEDFSIEIDDKLLTVSMEKHVEQEEKEGNFTRREFGYTNFKRSFTLPDTVNEDGITAQYEQGILRFSIPKKQEALPRPKRLIEVNT
ncbi:Hsp20/alpha crystallin family protein [Robiginitalea sp.]|jgi:HSP20 family protein|nr:Hsp20/alpha crystallin family protein [Robiginitalea sp.]